MILLVGCASDQPFTNESEHLLSDSNAKPGSSYEIGVYVVAAGDTVVKICQKFQISLKEYLALNPETGLRHLKVGQTVRVYERVK
jgi:LysM repeat protein